MADPTSDIFKVISDPTRRAIMDLLQEQALAVSDICGHFSMTQGAVSQHLKVLRDVNLVTVTRSGRQRLYAANAEPLAEIIDWVLRYHKFWPKRLDALDDYLKKKTENR